MLETMSASPRSATHRPPQPAREWPRGFMVLHGNRLEDLRDLLIEHLKAYPLPGLETEWVVVQSTGMKQWLEIGMAQLDGLGICAATRMVFPAELLWQVYRHTLGKSSVPEHMPLDREHLVWRLMRLLPALFKSSESGEYAVLQAYVADAQGHIDEGRLLPLCQQLAALYDGYQNYRSDWLRAWATGRAVLINSQGHSSDLPQGSGWQMKLWQALLSDVQSTHPSEPQMPSRAEVHQAYLEQIARATPEHLPKRVIVFGVSALPMQTIEALAALGAHAQVMVFVLNPSQHHWGDLVHERQVLRHLSQTRQRPKDLNPAPIPEPLSLSAVNAPLLAAWGQQGRDFLHLLDVHDHVDHYRHLLGRIDYFQEPLLGAGPDGATRLQRLQSDILNLNPLPVQPHPCPTDDDSFTFIRAHSPLREVELLQDQVLSWLEADPSLQPREIMVMVPDITPYAPLIQAVWGRFAIEDPRRIPFSISDQKAKDHPMAAIIEALLMGAQARFTLEDWLSWLEVPAFARAFGFPMQEWAQVRDTLQKIGVRWGLDSTHRLQTDVDLPAPDALPNTWMFGLQRLLLSQAQGPLPSRPWQDIWPADESASISPEALNALCHSLHTLHQLVVQLQRPRPPAQWVQDLQRMVDAVLLAQTEIEEKTKLALTAPLQQWLQSCQVAQLESEVSLKVVRTHWLTHLEDTLNGHRFLGGGVQFATLLPMRSIPFKRVCLLGMNDGVYPRRQPQSDFDLMQWPGQRRPGDRSKREDDRYLFLEALLCAREKVYISWQGWQMQDLSAMYPSVLVGQLMDHLGATHGESVSIQDAPMQAYSRIYFERPLSNWQTYADDWALARGWQAQAHWLAHRVGSAEPVTQDPLPETLTWSALVGLLRQPLDVYYLHRLGMKVFEPEQELPDAEPFDLDALQTHHWVLQAFQEPEQWSTRAKATGSLPLGELARATLKDIQAKSEVLVKRQQQVMQSGPWQAMPEQALNWAMPAAHGSLGLKTITGHIGGPLWFQNPDGQVLQIAPKGGSIAKRNTLQIHGMLGAWVSHVLANACGLHCTTHVLGLDQAKVLEAMPTHVASDQLIWWVQVYVQAWQSPMPVPGRTACTWMTEFLKSNAKSDEDARRAAAHQVAKGVFDGQYKSLRQPEKSSVPMMRRHAQEHEHVQDWVEQWAPRLYGGLMQALGNQLEQGRADED